MIYIISSGLDNVTKQLTDSTLREYVVDGLLPEKDYTIAVRGYYELLGPANTITVRLEGNNYRESLVSCSLTRYHIMLIWQLSVYQSRSIWSSHQVLYS